VPIHQRRAREFAVAPVDPTNAHAADVGEGGIMEPKNDVSSGQPGDNRFSPEEAQLFRQPDVLCVDEYLHVYRARPPETPERRLLVALLRDAIDCYLRDCCTENRHRKSSFREAEEWFFSTDDYGVFSLENVCDVLDINAGYIRRSLLDYQRKNGAGANSPGEKTHREPATADLRLAS